MANNDIVITNQDIESIIVPETVQAIQPNILYDFNRIIQIVKSNQQYLKPLIKSSEEERPILNDQEKKNVRIIFLNMIKLRQLLTGQTYKLWVGLEDGTSIETTLDQLADNQGGQIIVKNNQIEYSLNLVYEDLKKIDLYNEQLKALNQKLFPNTSPTGLAFKYQHSNKKQSLGQFYDNSNIALANDYYYYSLIGQKTNHIYTSKDALQYNRGHIYEWFLSDINKNGKPDMNIDNFMHRQKRDNIPFIKAGDTIEFDKKNKIIYAIQIKKINNKKLLTYKQIYRTLNILAKWDSGKNQKYNADIVKRAFLTKQDNLNKGAYTHVEKIIKELKGNGVVFN